MAQKIKQIALMVQAMHLKKMFPDSHVFTKKGNSMVWKYTLSPSPMGDSYFVKMIYNLGEKPKIYVIEPKPLKKAEGKNRLEHVYNDKDQLLCLYYGNEWNANMLLSETIVPWIYDWLFHYEIWVVGGEWTGGGIHPGRSKI